MASIRDVAKQANVAACTVSRVLNGTASVSPETRMRIERAMKELNYIPNELARGMFKQRAGIIAMLVPNIRHPFFSSLATYIEDELYRNGYKLMLCSTGDEMEREQEYLKILKSNIVDGVIMGANNQKPEEYKSNMTNGFPNCAEGCEILCGNYGEPERNGQERMLRPYEAVMLKG